METKVTRHSFFRGKAQYERFTEHAPLCVEENAHDLCNCTRAVVERPAGEPESVTQTVDFTETVGRYRMRLEMAVAVGPGREYDGKREEDNAVKFWVYWPRAEGKSRRKFSARSDTEEHAYFWFLREDHLKVEVTGTGDHGDIDCTLGTVCFGDEVDISKFFNGHSPSRVVDLSELSPDDVWVHACTIGDEAWAKLSDERTVEDLQRFRRLAARVREDVAHANMLDVSVKEVRARADSTNASRWLIGDCFNLLERVLDRFQESALRQDMVRVDEEATSRMVAKSRRPVLKRDVDWAQGARDRRFLEQAGPYSAGCLDCGAQTDDSRIAPLRHEAGCRSVSKGRAS